MSNENDVEKQFSKNIDHLLAGEKGAIGPDAENDVRSAADFAQKLIALRSEPSADFRSNLKARLLRKLEELEAERQAKQEQSWLRRLLPRQQAWQFALAVLFIAALGIALWGVLRPDTATRPAVQGELLRVEAVTNKSSYRPGEQVRIEVSLKNITSETLSIEHFPPLLSLMQAEARQPVYTFVEKRESRILAPGEEAEFELKWDQRDDRGKFAAPGKYYLELEDLDYQGRSLKLILTRPVHFNIH